MKNLLFLTLVFALVFPACSEKTSGPQNAIEIVCTTGMITDMVANIAGDKAQVIGLMGPGVDPHLYKASLQDQQLLNQAAMVFYNGLHLEGKMGEVLEKMGRKKPVIAIAESLDTNLLANPSGYVGAHDPHIWFDVSLWARTIDIVIEELSALMPEENAGFKERGEAYRTSLLQLHTWVSDQLDMLPDDQRILVTAHDAFGYFGKAYQMEVRGLQGISTVSEYGLRDIKNLTDYLTDKQINAVFVESSVPAKAMQAVVEGCASKGHTLRIGGTLFSDAMGEANTPGGTYIGMVKTNVQTILAGLQPQVSQVEGEN